MTRKICDIIDINLNLEKIEDIKISVEINGFILNYNSIDYLITLHQYYPIKSINIDNLQFEEQNIIQSSWNELLIIKNIDNKNYRKVKHIKSVLPLINQELYCKNELSTVIEYEYHNINNFPCYPRILYIKISKSDNHHYGLPVFQKNKKLIGIIASIYDDYSLVIPTYYILKIIQKECNNNIYIINNNNIKKIDKYNVKNKYVYHNQLSFKIPLDVYFTLEGDNNKKILINSQECTYVSLDYFPLSNERYLLKEDDYYIVNATLLIILKLIFNKLDNNFMRFIIDNLNEKIFLSVMKSDTINEESKENILISYNNYNESLYEFKLLIC